MKIPSSFKLFNTTVRVEWDNKELSYRRVWGTSDHNTGIITLCDKYQDEDISEDQIMDTFYHEKVHMILDTMGEHKLSGKEKFVDIFARLWRQSDETAVYDYECDGAQHENNN